jgi:hypothetical protein
MGAKAAGEVQHPIGQGGERPHLCQRLGRRLVGDHHREPGVQLSRRLNPPIGAGEAGSRLPREARVEPLKQRAQQRSRHQHPLPKLQAMALGGNQAAVCRAATAPEVGQEAHEELGVVGQTRTIAGAETGPGDADEARSFGTACAVLQLAMACKRGVTERLPFLAAGIILSASSSHAGPWPLPPREGDLEAAPRLTPAIAAAAQREGREDRRRRGRRSGSNSTP